MHPQRSFADVEYDGQPRQTRRERFLQRMDALTPWARLEARIRPVYPLALLLRIHCVQVFYNLSDPAMEDALYDSVAVQRFVGLAARGPRPDETTILNFRHLLERRHLGGGLLAEITHRLAAQGLRRRAVKNPPRFRSRVPNPRPAPSRRSPGQADRKDHAAPLRPRADGLGPAVPLRSRGPHFIEQRLHLPSVSCSLRHWTSARSVSSSTRRIQAPTSSV